MVEVHVRAPYWSEAFIEGFRIREEGLTFWIQDDRAESCLGRQKTTKSFEDTAILALAPNQRWIPGILNIMGSFLDARET